MSRSVLEPPPGGKHVGNLLALELLTGLVDRPRRDGIDVVIDLYLNDGRSPSEVCRRSEARRVEHIPEGPAELRVDVIREAHPAHYPVLVDDERRGQPSERIEAFEQGRVAVRQGLHVRQERRRGPADGEVPGDGHPVGVFHFRDGVREEDSAPGHPHLNPRGVRGAKPQHALEPHCQGAPATGDSKPGCAVRHRALLDQAQQRTDVRALPSADPPDDGIVARLLPRLIEMPADPPDDGEEEVGDLQQVREHSHDGVPPLNVDEFVKHDRVQLLGPPTSHERGRQQDPRLQALVESQS